MDLRTFGSGSRVSIFSAPEPGATSRPGSLEPDFDDQQCLSVPWLDLPVKSCVCEARVNGWLRQVDQDPSFSCGAAELHARITPLMPGAKRAGRRDGPSPSRECFWLAASRQR